MTPRQPYLIRALYDWILDNEATPYILVRVDDRTSVPGDFVRDGQIVLNISPTAVRDLAIDDDWLGFDGRFSGRSFSVLVPVNCVCAIYARESGEGMIFDGDLKDGGRSASHPPVASRSNSSERLVEADADSRQEGAAPPSQGNAGPVKGAPFLKVVK